jgi:hypothetical protein
MTSVLERRNAWFAYAFKLAISRELHRIWSNVLEEPVPPNLQRLIHHLEHVTMPPDTARPNGEQGRSTFDRVARNEPA